MGTSEGGAPGCVGGMGTREGGASGRMVGGSTRRGVRRGPMSNRLAHHFATMAYNNAWANHRLLTAVGRLSQADFVGPRTSFFPSIAATLNHNVTVDWYYVDALERGLRGQPVNPEARRFFEPEQPFATCPELHAAQREVDRRLVDLCAALTAEGLDARIGVLRESGIVDETAT